MGVDLKLLPMEGVSLPYNASVLNAGCGRALFDYIAALKASPINDDFACFITEYASVVTKDAYDTPLMYVLAGDLKGAKITGPTGAFVNALADDVKVVLYWH